MHIVPQTPQCPGAPFVLKNNIAHAPELYFERRHPFGKEVLEIVQGPGTDTPSVLAAIAHSAAVVMTLYCGGQSLASSKMYPNFNYIKVKDRSTKRLVDKLDSIHCRCSKPLPAFFAAIIVSFISIRPPELTRHS